MTPCRECLRRTDPDRPHLGHAEWCAYRPGADNRAGDLEWCPCGCDWTIRQVRDKQRHGDGARVVQPQIVEYDLTQEAR